MTSIREKIKRKLSLHDKNPTFDELHDENDVDEETHGHLHREIERAETDGHNEGRPGSFLNRLISHGNKKTEDQLARDQLAHDQAARERLAAQQQQSQVVKENHKPTAL